MAGPFVGIDPALAAAVARTWRRVGAAWRASAGVAAELTATLLLDATPSVLADRLADELETAARLLAERARALETAEELAEWLGTGRRGDVVAETTAPDEREWSALVAAGTTTDGGRTVRHFDLAADPGAGVVIADFFIPERASLFLAGDGRGHADPIFGPLSGADSRALLVLDLESGRGSVQFDDTCTAWAGALEVCREARPVELLGDPASPPWLATNEVGVGADGDSITVRYDILNGITPVGSTDGTFTLTDRGDGAYVLTTIAADEYPSIGIYQYRAVGEAPAVLLRHDSEGVGHLFPWWPDLGRVRGLVGPALRGSGDPNLRPKNERSTLD